MCVPKLIEVMIIFSILFTASDNENIELKKDEKHVPTDLDNHVQITIENIPIYLLKIQINNIDNSILNNFIKVKNLKKISVFGLSTYEDNVI